MKIPDTNGIVIDGFPRDIGQALSFEDQVCFQKVLVLFTHTVTWFYPHKPKLLILLSMVLCALLINYVSVHDWRQQSSLKPKLEYPFLQYALVKSFVLDFRILISMDISMELLKAGGKDICKLKANKYKTANNEKNPWSFVNHSGGIIFQVNTVYSSYEIHLLIINHCKLCKKNIFFNWTSLFSKKVNKTWQ